MLEDESGRICLVGDRIRSACLVTGVILGALGIETHNGDFEVVDLCYPGMAPQPSLGVPWSPCEGSDNAMEVDGKKYVGMIPAHSRLTLSKSDSLHSLPADEWIALVSGLDVGAASPADGQLQLLAEFLTAEVGGTEDQTQAARISRLIIAGNSLGTLSGNAGTTNADSERKPVSTNSLPLAS